MITARRHFNWFADNASSLVPHPQIRGDRGQLKFRRKEKYLTPITWQDPCLSWLPTRLQERTPHRFAAGSTRSTSALICTTLQSGRITGSRADPMYVQNYHLADMFTHQIHQALEVDLATTGTGVPESFSGRNCSRGAARSRSRTCCSGPPAASHG